MHDHALGLGLDCYFKPGEYKKAPEDFARGLHAACLAQPVRIAKVVRFKGPYLVIPAGLVPDIKVIHLVRHPKDLLRSQNKMGYG